jgi:hypothetical protein
VEQMNEKHYDYSTGLQAPYWLQEIRSPKGQLIWHLSTPYELSFFVVFFISLLILVWLSIQVNAVVNIPTAFTILFNVLVPYRLARFYCEFEPDGKRMHLFLLDTVGYFFNFILDKRVIYQGVKAEESKAIIIFEKSNL